MYCTNIYVKVLSSSPALLPELMALLESNSGSHVPRATCEALTTCWAWWVRGTLWPCSIGFGHLSSWTAQPGDIRWHLITILRMFWLWKFQSLIFPQIGNFSQSWPAQHYIKVDYWMQFLQGVLVGSSQLMEIIASRGLYLSKKNLQRGGRTVWTE